MTIYIKKVFILNKEMNLLNGKILPIMFEEADLKTELDGLKAKVESMESDLMNRETEKKVKINRVNTCLTFTFASVIVKFRKKNIDCVKRITSDGVVY